MSYRQNLFLQYQIQGEANILNPISGQATASDSYGQETLAHMPNLSQKGVFTVFRKSPFNNNCNWQNRADIFSVVEHECFSSPEFPPKLPLSFPSSCSLFKFFILRLKKLEVQIPQQFLCPHSSYLVGKWLLKRSL